MDKIEIDMYVAKFRKEMNFHTKKQEYDFKTKMNTYAKRDTFNITYELFKLCIEKDKQLENRPNTQVEVIEEVKTKSQKDILLDYQKQIEEMPTKYTKPTDMQEFHDVVNKLNSELTDMTEQIHYDHNAFLNEEINYHDDDFALHEDVSCLLEDTQDKIINKIGIAVDDWNYWGTNIKKNKLIYSPQSYEEYMVSIDQFIKSNPGVDSKLMINFKNELLQNRQLNQLLKSFKG